MFALKSLLSLILLTAFSLGSVQITDGVKLAGHQMIDIGEKDKLENDLLPLPRPDDKAIENGLKPLPKKKDVFDNGLLPLPKNKPPVIDPKTKNDKNK